MLHQAHGDHADPGEVDTSGDEFRHFGNSKPMPRSQLPTSSAAAPGEPMGLNEMQLRQMLMGFDRPGTGEPMGSNGSLRSENPALDDPMMKLLSQVMSPGSQGPSLFNMPANGTTPGQQSASQVTSSTRYAAIWRILHTTLALGLSLFLISTTSFSGTKWDRDRAAVGTMDDSTKTSQSFFLMFATTEALLLTTRFFLDRRREPPSGLLWTVTSLLPQPFKNYLKTALRYGQMFTTFRADLLLCIFVLGVYSWAQSA
jgi:GET complex subunit GET2